MSYVLSPNPLRPTRRRNPNIAKAEGNDHNAIWVAIVAAIGVVVAAVAPNWMKRKQENQDRERETLRLAEQARTLERYRAGFVSQIQSYEIMNTMLRDGSDRVVVWAGRNSGGVPCVGKPYHVDPVQAVTRYDTENVILGYRNLEVDEAYRRMLLKALERPLSVVVNTTTEMEPCMLKNFYTAEGITQAIIIGLGVDPDDNVYNYMSVATHKGEFTPAQITKFQVSANEIWQLILAGRVNHP